MAYKVIDVSVWQGDIDWQKVKTSGADGAIIRYADGDTLDSKFDLNMAGAKAAGLHVGCYIFSRAKTAAQAEREAERLFAAAAKYNPDMPLYIDLEATGLEKTANTVAQAFIKKMDILGGRGGVYANLNWFNNYLAATLTKYSDRPMWLAQYNDRITHKNPGFFGMWQYSSSGSVPGIKGRVDMDRCYIAYWDNAVNVEYVVEKKPYPGTMPSLKLVKTAQEVIDDAVTWALWIASDNRFHYGHGEAAHHNGCFFCGTNTTTGGRSKAGIKDYERTYCCNPFVGAAWAHGGCVPAALKLCRKGMSWDYHKGKGYDKSSLFRNLGKIENSKLRKGDVLCSDGHVALSLGNGKVIHASGGDDNKRGSERWNKSIGIGTWLGYTRVYRFKGAVDTTAEMRHGEVGKRIKDLQKYLIWYGIILTVDGIFGDATLAGVKRFQAEQGLATDGIVGKMTIAAMEKVVI